LLSDTALGPPVEVPPRDTPAGQGGLELVVDWVMDPLGALLRGRFLRFWGVLGRLGGHLG
jgi:hypothetical protein